MSVSFESKGDGTNEVIALVWSWEKASGNIDCAAVADGATGCHEQFAEPETEPRTQCWGLPPFGLQSMDSNDRKAVLHNIREKLNKAFKSGALESYERKPPREAELIVLSQAKKDVEEVIQKDGADVESYRLLALIQEALLQYVAAVKSYEEVLKLSEVKEKYDLKRLAMCRMVLADLKEENDPEDDGGPRPGVLP